MVVSHCPGEKAILNFVFGFLIYFCIYVYFPTCCVLQKESALVEVEVYIPTEGIIATFWYPASYLLPARSDGDGDGGISSPDAMNKEIHE